MQNARQVFANYRRICNATAIAAGIICYLFDPQPLRLKDALPFIALAAAMELSPVLLRDAYSEVAVTFPVLWAAVLLAGYQTGAFVAGASLLTANLIAFPSAVLAAKWGALSVPNSWSSSRTRRRPLLSLVTRLAGNWTGRHEYPFSYVLTLLAYNTLAYVMHVGIAGFVYTLVGGKLLNKQLIDNLSWSTLPGILGPFFVALIVYVGLDVAHYSAHDAILNVRKETGFSWRSFALNWRMGVRQYLPVTARNYAFLAPFSFFLAAMYSLWGPFSFLVLLIPFYAAKNTLRLTMDQWRTYRDTITTLGTLMQHYHPYTRGHLRRVAELSERLARELQMPPRTVMLMADAGMLHDIGKVGVSEEILDKTEQLSEEEWDIIRSHPVKGAEILRHLPLLDQIVDWVKYHHKWANGLGYPEDNINNGEVPLEAAIIAVADAFDAMTDDRENSIDWRCDSCGFVPENDERPDECPKCKAPKRRLYRKPLSLDQAIDQLRRGSGTQFHPDVVQAFVTMIDRDGVRLNAG